MRILPGKPDSSSAAVLVLQDRRRILRWIYAGRVSVAMTVMVATLLDLSDPLQSSQLPIQATGVFAGAAVLTVMSLLYSENERAQLPSWFLFLQTLVDLLLVTFVVSSTGGGESPLAAFYVVVIPLAFFLLPASGAIAATALGSAMYIVVVWASVETPGALLPASLVVAVLWVIAVVSRIVTLRLKEAGAGSAELAAQLEHMKLQAADILKNIRSGIITIDSNGRLLQANPAASNLLGIDLDEFMDRHVISRIHEVSSDLAEMLVRTVKRPMRITRGEAIMPRNGRNVPIGVTTTYAESENGLPATATAIFQDITESKRNEHLSLRAERLAAVAELSASLAHEIKNPLASIRSAVEQLARAKHANEDERTLAALVERESDRLSRLLSEFLDFARVQGAQFRTLDVASVVRGACALAGAHPDANEEVTIELDAPAEPLDMQGDEDLLHRAVFNLVLNAAQASPQGGKVSVRVSMTANAQLRSLGHLGSDVIEIVVADQGPGIPAEVRARIFDPFFTTKSGGTGLGLSVVHRAITSHRGEVLVDSGDDGTKFTVILPLEQTGGGDNT